MESNAPPEILFFLMMLVIFVPYAFFLINRNAKLKRRLWPAYAIGTSIAVVTLFWLMGAATELLLYLVVPLFAAGALINLRVAKFCDACGATINNAWRAAWLLPPARVCPECGASLQQGGASSTGVGMSPVPPTPRDQVMIAGPRSRERTVLVYGGWPGIAGAVLIVLAFLVLGTYSVYGLEYLQFLPWLLSGDFLRYVIFLSLWCSLYHYLTWRHTTPRAFVGASASLPEDTLTRAVASAAATFAALALIYMLLLHYFDAWCFFLKAPFWAMLVFFALLWGPAAWIRRLRRQAMLRTAFAILLVSDAAVSFALSQVLTLDHFRKGAERYTQGRGHTVEIASSSKARFFIDYARNEFVLAWPSVGNPTEHRRPFPPSLCQ
jgi:hypothetical protein